MKHELVVHLLDIGKVVGSNLGIHTSAESIFYLALYASVGQEPKHIMAQWHFCNSRQLLCLG